MSPGMETLALDYSDFFKSGTLHIVLFIAGVLIMIFSLKRKAYLKAKGKKSVSSANFSSVKTPTAAELKAMSNDLNRYIVELHETSRRIAAQIENRTTMLELLIAEADAKIKKLEAMQSGNQPIGGNKAPKADAPLSAFTPPAAPQPIHIPPTESTPAPQPSIYENLGRSDFQKSNSRIYQLADLGKNPREIAQELNASPGEVELILNLRAKRI